MFLRKWNLSSMWYHLTSALYTIHQIQFHFLKSTDIKKYNSKKNLDPIVPGEGCLRYPSVYICFGVVPGFKCVLNFCSQEAQVDSLVQIFFQSTVPTFSSYWYRFITQYSKLEQQLDKLDNSYTVHWLASCVKLPSAKWGSLASTVQYE